MRLSRFFLFVRPAWRKNQCFVKAKVADDWKHCNAKGLRGAMPCKQEVTYIMDKQSGEILKKYWPR